MAPDAAEGPWRRYGTEAIFIHQTAIVVLAHAFSRLRWSASQDAK